MSITASVIDGKIVANYTADTSSSTTGSDSLDKDAFLKILVAEMQYQDPLEPSSNTEWVTQMASFSTVEELQELGSTIEQQSAANLVGKRVIVAASTSTDGSVNYVTGIVQCTEQQSDGVYLSIDDLLYKYDTLYAVVDEDYYNSLMSSTETEETAADSTTDTTADESETTETTEES